MAKVRKKRRRPKVEGEARRGGALSGMVQGFRRGVRGERGSRREVGTRLAVAVGVTVLVLAVIFWKSR